MRKRNGALLRNGKNCGFSAKKKDFKRGCKIPGKDNIVFFGGAGVSTESGIPDFRSVDGLYNQEYDYPPETILSHTFYRRNTEEFYRFYRNKMLCLTAQPNMAHKKLAELEAAGKVRAVVTQNIDGLHGSVHRNYCESCHEMYDARFMLHSTGVPHCEKCGGEIKPDVVLYEEGLDNRTIQEAVYYISHADMLIIGGTSLAVYPAAGLIDYYQGNKLVLVNKSATPRDDIANLALQESIGELFGRIRHANSI